MHQEFNDILNRTAKEAKTKMEVYFEVKFQIEDVLKNSKTSEAREYWERQLSIFHAKAKAYEVIYDAVQACGRYEPEKV